MSNRLPGEKKISGKQQSQVETRRRWMLVWAFAALISIAAVVPFAFSLGGEFVFDDRAFIIDDNAVHSLGNIPGAFVRCFGPDAPYYRPFVSVSYITNYAMFGLDPLGYRVVNLLFHALSALLVFLLARRILRGNAASLLAALIFAVHPAHAESAAWISGRTDLLMAVFALASVLAFLKYDKLGKRSWYLVSLGLFLGALLSKESVIIMPALIFILVIVRKPQPGIKKAVAESIPFAIIAVLFFFIRMHVLGQAFFDYGGETVLPLSKRLITAPAAMLWYCKILFLPFKAEPLHDIYMKHGLWSLATIVSTWIGLGGLLIAAVAMRRRFAVASFGILWILIALFPVANIITIPWPVLCERFLYLPSVGLSLIFGLFGGWLISRRRPVFSSLLLSCFLVYCAFQSYAGARLWTTDVILASQMVKSAPKLFSTHIVASEAYARAGKWNLAIKEYKLISNTNSINSVDAHAKLVRLYGKIKDYKSALREARIVVRMIPDNPYAYNDLGAALLRNKDIVGAINAYSRAVKIGPKEVGIRFNLAHALAANNEFKKAVEQYRIGLKQQPENERARLELGLALWQNQQENEAEIELRAVAEQGGTDAENARGALREMKGNK